jgi:hypothetical protein
MTKIKEAGQEGMKKIKQLKNMANSIRSGQFLNDIKNAAIETAIQSVPGGKLISAAVEAGHVAKDKIEAKGMEKQARDAGVHAATAKQFSKSYVEDNRKTRQVAREKRAESANRFVSTFMPNVQGKMFSAIPSMHAVTEAEKAKYTPEYGKQQKKKRKAKFQQLYGPPQPGGKKKGKK